MASVTFALDEDVKRRLSKFVWIVWSELVRAELSRRQEIGAKLLKQLNSPEEQELIRWSVDLGRRAKKGRFKQLLKEISPEAREKLLSKHSAKRREELLK